MHNCKRVCHELEVEQDMEKNWLTNDFPLVYSANTIQLSWAQPQSYSCATTRQIDFAIKHL